VPVGVDVGGGLPVAVTVGVGETVPVDVGVAVGGGEPVTVGVGDAAPTPGQKPAPSRKSPLLNSPTAGCPTLPSSA
jgi:hypothetical protein